MNERLLELFHTHQGRYLSGEWLSGALNVSRTAVWKHIQGLKEEGYTFDASPRLGYKLTGVPDRVAAAELLSQLRTRTFGRRIHIFDEVSSTQNVALEQVRNGAPEGTLVIAERQTSGRGRLGRHWHSPKGKGIYMSLVLKPAIPLVRTPQLTLLAAVALYRTIRRVVPEVEPGIKWPNDLLIRDKKISGILLESSAENESLSHIIAGVGISVNLEASDYPEELADKATSLLIEAGRPIDRTELAAEFLAQMEELYNLFLQQGFAPIRLLWEASSWTLGRNIRVMTADGPVTGRAKGLDEWGGLQLELENGRPYTVYSVETQVQD